MVRFIANGLFHWSIQCAIVPITENCYAWNQTRANVLLLLCTAYNINANRIGSVFSDFQLCRCFIHTLRKMKENTKVLQIQERIPNEKKKIPSKTQTKFVRSTEVVVCGKRFQCSSALFPQFNSISYHQTMFAVFALWIRFTHARSSLLTRKLSKNIRTDRVWTSIQKKNQSCAASPKMRSKLCHSS